MCEQAMTRDLAIVIPALKKHTVFPDDLVKKLAGTTLLQRAINLARSLVSNQDIHLVTDSDEISLVAQRNGVNFFYEPGMRVQGGDYFAALREYLARLSQTYGDFLLLHAYTPLISAGTIQAAYQKFAQEDCDILQSVREVRVQPFQPEAPGLGEALRTDHLDRRWAKVNGFSFFKSGLINQAPRPLRVGMFALDEQSRHIRSHHDWWVCEKVIKRRRVIFRVVGNRQVGLGHVYRGLTLAHEITDHEVIFACDKPSREAVETVLNGDYPLYAFEEDQMAEGLSQLEPHLVINDILDTSRPYVQSLRDNGVAVVNFEDLGDGATAANLTINEIYDVPRLEGPNLLWGKDYVFLRDEFSHARPRAFSSRVRRILLTFGGTDQHNLLLKALREIQEFCGEQGIAITVVGGPGCVHKSELKEHIARTEGVRIDCTFDSGVMSGVMEQCDLAVSSNGRTVYELCHMNIPSIIISQHAREMTHEFARRENGMIHLGLYQSGRTESRLGEELRRLVGDHPWRRELHDNMRPQDFVRNKALVIKEILSLLEN